MDGDLYWSKFDFVISPSDLITDVETIVLFADFISHVDGKFCEKQFTSTVAIGISCL